MFECSTIFNFIELNYYRKIHWEYGNLEARAEWIVATVRKEVVEVICLHWKSLKSLSHGQSKLTIRGYGSVIISTCGYWIRWINTLSQWLWIYFCCTNYLILQLSVEEAFKSCRYDWMIDALKKFLLGMNTERTQLCKSADSEDSTAKEHQMYSPTPGCSVKKPSGVHHQLEKSCTNDSVVQV